MTVMKNIIRIITVILAAVLLFSLVTSCTKKKDEMISMYDLQKALLAADDTLPEMMTVNSSSDGAEDLFTYVSDVGYSKVEGFIISYSSKGLADEIVVVCMKEESDVSEMIVSLNGHRDSRVLTYQNYDPSQTERAQNALVFSHGRYAALIISDNQDDVKAELIKQIDG